MPTICAANGGFNLYFAAIIAMVFMGPNAAATTDVSNVIPLVLKTN